MFWTFLNLLIRIVLECEITTILNGTISKQLKCAFYMKQITVHAKVDEASNITDE